MRYAEFQMTCSKFWDAYFHWVSRGTLILPNGCSILWPTHILFTESADHYVMELAGASERPKTLQRKIMRSISINEYFNSFSITEKRQRGMAMAADHCAFNGISFVSDKVDMESMRDRFGSVIPLRVVFECSDGVISLDHNATHNLCFESCSFVAAEGRAIRYKHTVFAFISKKSSSPLEIDRNLCAIVNAVDERRNRSVHGISAIPSEDVETYVLFELLSLALSSGTMETTLGSFLDGHADATRRMFRTERFLSEVKLDWVDGNEHIDEKGIRPDLMIKRPDGFYDIVDLKLPLLRRNRITKGGSKRRRFLDYVSEGIAQLSNYEAYFSSSRNAEHAERKYNISVRDPVLYLIVGNSENYNPKEVQQAMRMFSGKRLSVVDWDSLIGISRPRAWGGL